MPWWGWLIAFGIVCASLTAVAVVVLMTRTMKSMNDDFEQHRQSPQRFRGVR